jgi:hypothetical protein
VPGPPPKPGAIRRNRPTFEWVELPAEGRTGKPPKLPAWRKWHKGTVEAWNGWWSTPQATQWDESGRSLLRWALLFDRLMTEPDCPVSVHTQIQVIEDRHGFSQRSMLNLRWRIKATDPDPTPDTGSRSASQAKAVAARLKVVK